MAPRPVLLLRPVPRAAAVASLVKSHPVTHPGPVSRAQAEAGNYKKRRIAWRGLTLRVENEAGTIREGHGWQTRMVVPYGEVEDTVGLDGDRVDVFIGPDLETAAFVYVVHQRRYGAWDEHDEDKVMLGFASLEDAAVMYMQHYDDPRFLGPITAMPVEEFVARCKGDEEVTRLGKSWFGDADLLKATLKKTITVPGYYKADGSWVAPHQKQVHYNPDHHFTDIAAGGVSHSQKQAHKKLSGEAWFQQMPMEDKAAHVMSHATDIQDAASASAAVSGWKAAAKAGKHPSAAQWAAFNALSKEKQAGLYDEVKAAAGSLAHLSANPETPASAEMPADDDGAEQLASAPKGLVPTKVAPPPAKPAGPTPAQNAEAEGKLAHLEQHGSHYQKVAIAKLKADPGWQSKSHHDKHEAVISLYKQLQGEASASAAVSMWKKSMLAGKVPSGSQHAAYAALATTNPKKQAELTQQVIDVIGGEKTVNLIHEAVQKHGIDANGPTADAGPHDGETKPAADGGTLVFHDGHWVKQDGGEQPYKAPKGWLGGGSSITTGNASITVSAGADGKHSVSAAGQGVVWFDKPTEAAEYVNSLLEDHAYDENAAHLVVKDVAGLESPAQPAAAAKPELPSGWIFDAADGGFSGQPTIQFHDADESGFTFYASLNGEGGVQVGVLDSDGNPVDHDDYYKPQTALLALQHKMKGYGIATPNLAAMTHFMEAGAAAFHGKSEGRHMMPKKAGPQPLSAESFKGITDVIGLASNGIEIQKAVGLALAGDLAGIDLQLAAIPKAKAKTASAVKAIAQKAKLFYMTSPDVHADVSAWFDTMFAGKEPTAALWAVIDALPEQAKNSAVGGLFMALPDKSPVFALAQKQLQAHYHPDVYAKAKAEQEAHEATQGKPNPVLTVGGKTVTLQGKAAKVNGIDTAEVMEWLAAAPGKANPYAKFFSLAGSTDVKKFQAWNNYAKQALSSIVYQKYASMSLSSLFGKADHWLGADGQFHHKHENADPIGVETDIDKIKLAAVKELAGIKSAPRVKSVIPTPTTPPMPQTITAAKTILHNTEDGHYKEWSVHVIGNKMVTEYGKIGGTQQKTEKTFANATEAHAAAEKLKHEKFAKGYVHHHTDYGHQVQVDGGGTAPAAASDPAKASTFMPDGTALPAGVTFNQHNPITNSPSLTLPTNDGGYAVVTFNQKLSSFTVAAYSKAGNLKDGSSLGNSIAVSNWLEQAGSKKAITLDHLNALKATPDASGPAGLPAGWSTLSNGSLHFANAMSQTGSHGASIYPQANGTYDVNLYGPGGVVQTSHKGLSPDSAAHIVSAKMELGTKLSAHQLQAATAGADGPKDGDTKQGADGVLVFKDGHWHKVADSYQKVSKVKADKAVKRALEAFGVGFLMGPGKATVWKAKELANKGDVAGLIKLKMETQAAGGGLANAKLVGALNGLINAMGVDPAAIPGASSAPPKVASVKPTPSATVGAPGVAAQTYSPAPAAGPPSTVKPLGAVDMKPGDPTDMKGWVQTGAQMGSNAGGKFKDKNGIEWYCKFPASENVARNELLAAKFYQMLGAKVPNLKLVKKDGKVGIASKWTDGLKKTDAATLAKTAGAHEGFVFDAWMGNWDVVGASNDNLLVGKDGAVRVDVGGSLIFRAQGGKKTDFGDTVPELDSMLAAGTNPKAAAVFKGISHAQLMHGVQQLNKLKDSQIEELVDKIGPGSAEEKKKLAATLIARRAFILKKFGVTDQWTTVPKLDPKKLPVNAKDLPKPLDFSTINGGKPLSSKAWKNDANSKDSAALVAFAAQGNLVALKEYEYDEWDEASGKPTGKKKPITQHPSNKIQQQWTELVELLQSIATPSIPTLEMPSIGGVGALEEISDFVGSFAPTERPETVATEHRLGFFMALNQIDDIHDLTKDLKWHFLPTGGSWAQSMKAKFSSLSAKVRSYISAVQSSGSINHVWSQGKSEAQGMSIHALSAEIYKEAVEVPEGTVLRRGMSDTTAGKQMTKLLLQAKPGLVIQNTDSMCTSYNENHGWGGDVQMTIRCAKGCKATPSFASGKYGGEYEITTLPGQRFVVLKVEKSGSGVKLDVLMLPPHEGYVTQLKKLSGLAKALQSVVLFLKKVV